MWLQTCTTVLAIKSNLRAHAQRQRGARAQTEIHGNFKNNEKMATKARNSAQTSLLGIFPTTETPNIRDFTEHLLHLSLLKLKCSTGNVVSNKSTLDCMFEVQHSINHALVLEKSGHLFSLGSLKHKTHHARTARHGYCDTPRPSKVIYASSWLRRCRQR